MEMRLCPPVPVRKSGEPVAAISGVHVWAFRFFPKQRATSRSPVRCPASRLPGRWKSLILNCFYKGSGPHIRLPNMRNGRTLGIIAFPLVLQGFVASCEVTSHEERWKIIDFLLMF